MIASVEASVFNESLFCLFYNRVEENGGRKEK